MQKSEHAPGQAQDDLDVVLFVRNSVSFVCSVNLSPRLFLARLLG